MRAALVLAFLLVPRLAAALGVEIHEVAPTVLGQASRFTATVDGAVGTAELRWDFGDGERGELTAGLTRVEHTYAAPGHHAVIVVARDEAGFASATAVHTVHRPLVGAAPSSATIVHDPTRGLVCNVNPDDDSVACIDADSFRKVGEVAVYAHPSGLALAPDGRLWVVHRDDYAVALVDLDTFRVVGGFRLPYASQPAAIVVAGETAYVSLQATGRVLELDARTGETRATIDVGPWPRGLAVSHDGRDLYVTRFISGDGQAEVTHVVDGAVVGRLALVEDTTSPDDDQSGRGLASYLFSIAISPDGREAWVPSKKDNLARGLFRDGQPLTQDNTVRPLVSVLELGSAQEDVAGRMDLDDRNLPAHVLFSPLGDYAFVSVLGSSLVEVRDVYTRQFVTAMRSSGLGHTSSVLDGRGRLFVHAALSRSIVVYDVAEILSGHDRTTRQLADVAVVAAPKLGAELLRGQQIFTDSEDPRMAAEGYLSCASCHIDGFEDGRVWDFADRGEGLRNTTSLLGRRGLGQGPVHWTGNFDEIQDFEGAIREKFGGRGFMADADFAAGTRSQPLGDPKAGQSPELDALAAYVSSLAAVPRSPFSNPDGTLTAAAERGRAHFLALDCQRCHAGDDFTDSASGARHDVGTLSERSGARLGETLTGLDTPTLLGVWQTAPYLHDGSAATLRDVLTTRNPDGLHGAVAMLSDDELDELVAYLEQLDQGVPPTPLPFELPADEPGGCAVGHGDGGLAWVLLALAQVRRRRRLPPIA